MELKTDIHLIITSLICTIISQSVESVINSSPHQNSASNTNTFHDVSKPLVTKFSLTQKGYIQFLRYVVDVPELTDYTFCIWVRSNNLTHNHPLLSYSKEEQERLIRVWISPLGTHINLEILEVPIFSIPIGFVEHEWYHVCQSWSSYLGAWSFYLNGKLKASGLAPKLKNIPIKSEGDIVVGQEYTDFDKGLDDGIEGDISGFNFVLASTFQKSNVKHGLNPRNHIFKRDTNEKDILQDPFFADDKQFTDVMKETDEKSVTRRQIWDESLEFFSKHRFVPPLPLDHSQDPSYKNQVKSQRYIDYLLKPLGLLLVELSNDCGYLRGAPLSGRGVLVSWTKTQVRVFGGAILKTVPPFCLS